MRSAVRVDKRATRALCRRATMMLSLRARLMLPRRRAVLFACCYAPRDEAMMLLARYRLRICARKMLFKRCVDDRFVLFHHRARALRATRLPHFHTMLLIRRLFFHFFATRYYAIATPPFFIAFSPYATLLFAAAITLDTATLSLMLFRCCHAAFSLLAAIDTPLRCL